jgi:hypothetical protein
MKALAMMVVLLSLTALAAAKPTPESGIDQIRDLNPTALRNDTDINSGTSGALLERSYFQAPQRQFNVSCRLQLNVFDKTRLIESCN